MRPIMLALALALGILTLGNGAYMLLAPQPWYAAVPGVITTGPFNQHFIRDIGLIFILVGAAFLVGAARTEARRWLWSAAAIWLAGHALFHVWEVLAGICGPDALQRDFLAVSLPAIIAVALTVWAFRSPEPRLWAVGADS